MSAIWCFCEGLPSIPRVYYPGCECHEDVERGYGLVENDSADWSEFTAPDELYAELDAMEEDLPF